MTQVPGSQVHVPGKCLEFVANWFTFPVAFRQFPCVGTYVSFL